MAPFRFADFVAKFPPVSMPVTLGEDTHHTFSAENEPLPDVMIEQFIFPLEKEGFVADEFTEYVPCFAIEGTEHFIALVWWKAELLNYEYILATFTDKGQCISHRILAETKVRDGKVLRSVATINEDWEVYIALGESIDGNMLFDPTSSKTLDMEIMSNGEIV